MPELTGFLVSFWIIVSGMAPYLLFGFAFAGLLAAFVSPHWISRHLSGKGLWPIFKAALFGVPLPLCSCGVIPVAASLRQQGAGKPATVSFLLSTPQTGIDSILATYGVFGWPLALYRAVIALLTGFIGGAIVLLFEHSRETSIPNAEVPRAEVSIMQRVFMAVHYAFIILPRDIGGSLLLGLVLAGAIGVLLPPEFVSTYFSAAWLQMLAMLLLSLPLYVCATGSIPIAAALVAKGVSPGAALVFLMAGPATNVATVTTLWRVLGRRTTAFYLATTIGCALAFGLSFDLLFGRLTFGTNLPHCHDGDGGHVHGLLPVWFDNLCGIALMGLLLLVFGRRLFKPKRVAAPTESQRNELLLKISGMHCEGCVNGVRNALAAMPGVHSIEVDLAAGQARIVGSVLNPDAIAARIKAVGFEAEPRR